MLLPLLLLAVAVLAVLVGLIMLTGSYRGTRVAAVAFAVACFGAAAWTVSMSIFLNTADIDVAASAVLGMYISPLVMSLGLLFYGLSLLKSKVAMKIGGGIAVVGVVALAAMLVAQPELLYSAIIMESGGNSVELVMGLYYFLYAGAFVLMAIGCVGAVVRKITSMRRSRERSGYAVMFWGLLIWFVPFIAFNLVLPPTDYSLMWIGPISVVVALLFCYFATLRYRIIELKQLFAQIFSYVLVLAIAAMVYMLIFYLIFTALFRVSNPSAEIFVLNFIMIVIVLLLLPIVNEFLASARSIIARDSIDLTYIVKRLNRLATSQVDLKNLAEFLADHLHFGYVGFLIDGKTYGSRKVKISISDLTEIVAAAEGTTGIWQKVNVGLAESLDGKGINMVAMLYDANGNSFGRILIGESRGKDALDRRDIIQLETIINLIAIVVESEVRGTSKKRKLVRRRRAKANSH